MENIKLNIDGREVETQAGKSVLDAALDAGIYIPHLCHHPDLFPAGACRLCIIETGDGLDAVAACTTAAVAGMNVKTRSPRIDRSRLMTMELILANHPSDCTTCPKYLNCELQSLKQYFGVSEELRVKRRLKESPAVRDNLLFTHDFSRCILCGRCVRACNDLRGVGVLSFIQSGKDTHIGTAFDRSLLDAGCKFCGACAEVCPTGALRDSSELMDPQKSRRASLIPCRYTCPAEIDVPRYLRFISEKNFGAAVAIIREKVPFPAVLGYVCNHPCELVCRHGHLNDAIAIRDLKRFAAENDDGQWKRSSHPAGSTGKRVAVVGAGPAGLTAAYYLAVAGHGVTVFEAMPQAGGMLRYGIPAYRLPRDVSAREIECIREAGVEIRTGVKVDSLDKLSDEGYDAILVAVGTHRGQKLPLPGADLENVIVGIDFLRDVNMVMDVKIGSKVLVLGGGNVAIDCARVAKRLGAEAVAMACLECGDAMLASPEEIEQATGEGIVIHPAHSFIEITGIGGRVSGVVCRNVKSFEFDEDGQAQVEVEEDSEHTLPADTVIFALGQRPDVPEDFNLDTGRGGVIEVDEFTRGTSRDGVFAAGDAVSGTSSVIEAIASARKIASVIDSYLGGSGEIEEKLAPVSEPDAFLGRDEEFAALKRCPPSLVPGEQRQNTFDGIVDGYGVQSAVKEASRCLRCDLRFKISPIKFWADYPSK